MSLETTQFVLLVIVFLLGANITQLRSMVVKINKRIEAIEKAMAKERK